MTDYLAAVLEMLGPAQNRYADPSAWDRFHAELGIELPPGYKGLWVKAPLPSAPADTVPVITSSVRHMPAVVSARRHGPVTVTQLGMIGASARGPLKQAGGHPHFGLKAVSVRRSRSAVVRSDSPRTTADRRPL